MLLRRYQPEDAIALATLRCDTIRRVNSRDYTPVQIDAWAREPASFLPWFEQIQDRTIVIAEADGRLIGFGDIRPADGFIDHFYVHADWQRRGVGRAIIKELLAEARRSGMPQLFSHVSITARPFFESQGFCVEAAQRVTARGVEFINFRMSRQLLELNGRQQS